nr:hypothetical protein [uncultured Sphingomonas sp.]
MPVSASPALEETLVGNVKPEVFNTDQGCQFISFTFTSLQRNGDVRAFGSSATCPKI